MGVDTNYRDKASSTELMQQAFEDSGYVEKGHGQKLAWHEGLETYDQANEARKDAPGEVAKKVGELGLDKVAEEGAKFVAKRVFGEKALEIAERAMNPLSPITDGAVKAVKATVKVDGMIGLAIVGAGVATIAAAVKTVADGDRMQDHQDTISLDLATTQLLTLDPDYRHSVIKKYEGNVESDTVMKQFRAADGSLTAYGRAVVPKLQAVCDAGCRAGFDAVRTGGVAEFLKSHPDIAERRQKDIAFAKGFDQVIFAANCGDGGHKLVEIKKGVDERDARTTSSVVVRG